MEEAIVVLSILFDPELEDHPSRWDWPTLTDSDDPSGVRVIASSKEN